MALTSRLNDGPLTINQPCSEPDPVSGEKDLWAKLPVELQIIILRLALKACNDAPTTFGPIFVNRTSALALRSHVASTTLPLIEAETITRAAILRRYQSDFRWRSQDDPLIAQSKRNWERKTGLVLRSVRDLQRVQRIARLLYGWTWLWQEPSRIDTLDCFRTHSIPHDSEGCICLSKSLPQALVKELAEEEQLQPCIWNRLYRYEIYDLLSRPREWLDEDEFFCEMSLGSNEYERLAEANGTLADLMTKLQTSEITVWEHLKQTGWH